MTKATSFKCFDSKGNNPGALLPIKAERWVIQKKQEQVGVRACRIAEQSMNARAEKVQKAQVLVDMAMKDRTEKVQKAQVLVGVAMLRRKFGKGE